MNFLIKGFNLQVMPIKQKETKLCYFFGFLSILKLLSKGQKILSWSGVGVVHSRVGVRSGVLLRTICWSAEWSATPIFELECGVECYSDFCWRTNALLFYHQNHSNVPVSVSFSIYSTFDRQHTKLSNTFLAHVVHILLLS